MGRICGTGFPLRRCAITFGSMSRPLAKRFPIRLSPRSRTSSGQFAASGSASVCNSGTKSGGARWILAPLLVIALIALTPEVAHAWTPGTHIYIGEAVMRSLAVLPPAVRDLLLAFPADFLYGSIAADTSIAKKYAAAGRHCHSWAVGFEIYDAASREEPLQAFALGYLSHLAADAVAHNYFVPRQLTITSTTAALGHSYWESRFELHLGERYSRRARELILQDHLRADTHLDRILSPTIFSTPTNRRIFRGMVLVADSESWQRIFTTISEKSRWDLPDAEVTEYLARSFDFVMDLLTRWDRAEPFALDPAGTEPLRLAKRVRRASLRRGGEDFVIGEALRRFGLPHSTLHYARTLTPPIYAPTSEPNS
jgi:hypothetical protein